MSLSPRSHPCFPALITVACIFFAWRTGTAWFMPGQSTALPEQTTNAKIMTVVDYSVQDLLRLYSGELGKLAFDENPQALDFLLSRVGKNVEAFFNNLRDVTAKERVVLERLNENSKVRASTSAIFDYLILLQMDLKGTNIEEYRSDAEGKTVKLADRKELSSRIAQVSGYMVTSGFASHCIFLHPSHRTGSRFRYLGKMTAEPYSEVMAFAQKPEKGDYLVSIAGNSVAAVLLQGLVWVDPQTYQIVRMRTDLLEPGAPNGVLKQTTEIRTDRVLLDDAEFWLPREVVVTLRRASMVSYEQSTDGGKRTAARDALLITTFRNVHTYSNYKRFTVESTIRFGNTTEPPVKK